MNSLPTMLPQEVSRDSFVAFLSAELPDDETSFEAKKMNPAQRALISLSPTGGLTVNFHAQWRW